MDGKITFNIKKPSPGKGGRASFAVNQRILSVNGTSKYSNIDNEQLRSINSHYRSGAIPFESALAQVKLIVKNLYKEKSDKDYSKEIFNSENEAILDQYWKKEYAHRIIEDPESAWNDLNRAVKGVGHLPLLSSDRQTLQAHINKSFREPEKHRRIVKRLNQILKFLKREFVLTGMNKKFKQVRHVNFKEMAELGKAYEPDSIQNLAIMSAFATGMRLGELFSPIIIKNKKYVYVKSQMDRKLEIRLTKNRKQRNTFIIPELYQCVAKWAAIDQKTKEEFRNSHWATIVKSKTKKLWPDEKLKQLVFHDLRHCYAIYLISKGVSLTQLAYLLGDSLQVTQEYYAGFVATEETIDLIDSIYKKSI